MTSPTVNLVIKPGWILGRCAQELVDRIPGVELNATGYRPEGPTDHAITYFAPMVNLRHMPDVRGVKVGFFTHGEERVRAYWNRFDACVAMNRRIAAQLQQLGARNVVTIRPGVEPAPRRPRFGVCGRVYGKARKGAHLVRFAVQAGYDFRACSEHQRGKPPPCPITHPIERRSDFYREIDYLVVTSTDEGGPMPVPEAVAHGVPVIAPDVGWSWEWPVIRYELGSWKSLQAVLRGLSTVPTWEGWAAGHQRLFASLV